MFENRLNGWEGKLLSIGGRLIPINFVLSSLSVFILSFFEVPKGVVNDVFRWDLQRNVSFSVRLMYKYLINNNILSPQDIWRTRLHFKIKSFIWYLKKKGVLMTKYNLSRRNWHGDKTCAFYCRTETIQYLFFDCLYAKFL
ncbi:hypothetical protein U9M48_035109, partial [Paspalum notatum var. saurae]